MNFEIVSAEDSEVYLEEFSDWLALSGTTQENHLRKASVYVQSHWTCDDVDWNDDETIPVAVLEAISYYAYASFHGNLYGDVSATPATIGKKKRTMDKAGSVVSEVEYFGSNSPGTSTNRPLAYPDDLMSSYCSRGGFSSNTLERV